MGSSGSDRSVLSSSLHYIIVVAYNSSSNIRLHFLFLTFQETLHAFAHFNETSDRCDEYEAEIKMHSKMHIACCPPARSNEMSAPDLFVWMQDTLSTTYTTLSSADLPGMSTELIATTRVYLDRLTLGGNLPTLPALTQPAVPAIAVRKGIVTRTLDGVREHFVIALLLGSGVGGSLVYFYVPRTAYRPLLKPIRPFIPLLLLPTSTRPLHVPATPTTPEIRREAVLVLGAGSPLIIDLVLDLEKRGFVVICTAADVRQVELIERRSRGWIKVLLLNPEDSTSVAPFLKSFSTALSLRFPLRTAGDPYARPDHTLGLTTVINCLSLHETGAGGGLGPVEGIELENVRWMLGERVATVIGVLKGVLPIMRPISGRTSAEDSIILTLGTPFRNKSAAFTDSS